VLWYPVDLNKPGLPFGHPFVLRNWDRLEQLDQTPLGTDQTEWTRYRGQTPAPAAHHFCGTADQWTNGLSYETYLADGYQCDCPQLVMVASGGSAGGGTSLFPNCLTNVFAGTHNIPCFLHVLSFAILSDRVTDVHRGYLIWNGVDAWEGAFAGFTIRFVQYPPIAVGFGGESTGPCVVPFEARSTPFTDPFMTYFENFVAPDLACGPAGTVAVGFWVSELVIGYMYAVGGSAGGGSAEWSTGFEMVSAGGSAGDGVADWPGGDLFVSAGGSAGDGSADWPGGDLFVSAGGSAGAGVADWPGGDLFVSAGGGSAGDGSADFL